ncbi:hypothetical protein MLD38_003602 [Melastoma candidum]|uniref:Uncharacterized protein n=1 Tax=Melastoma candidum TaxID=119954 RepID=A0ACB9S3T1_9MYRT|nr:hypothetical protein MLD38_003602 [Melastoma candidum]
MMLPVLFTVVFSAVPLTLYLPPLRNLNLFVETMENVTRDPCRTASIPVTAVPASLSSNVFSATALPSSPLLLFLSSMGDRIAFSFPFCFWCRLGNIHLWDDFRFRFISLNPV